MVLGIAGAMIGSALIGGAVSAFGAKRQNEAAQSAAREQMAFQKESAQNQYQWAMDDMRKAGLNPILAYKQGGAGTLGGSSYSPVNVGAAAAAGGQAGFSSALAAKRFNLEERKNIAEIDKLYTSADKDSAESKLAHTTNENVKAQRRLIIQQYNIRKPDVSSAKHAEQLYKGPFGSFFKWWQMMKRR